MKAVITVSIAIVAIVVTAGAFVPAASIDNMSWLAGCWQSARGERVIDEQWMKPLGGMMMGMSRTVSRGRLVEFEHTRIRERGANLIFEAQPSGQPAAEFTSIRMDERSVVFENKAHDFPQRILYRTGPADSLFARIEGTVNGAARGVDFSFARVRCAGQ